MCSQGQEPVFSSCVTVYFPKDSLPAPSLSFVFLKPGSHLKAWFWANRLRQLLSGPVGFRWFHFVLGLTIYKSKESPEDHCQLPCRSVSLANCPSGTSQLAGTLVHNVTLILTRTSV